MDKKWWTLIAVLAGTFMLLLDVTIVIVAQPEIQTALHASLGDVQWVVDAYALTLAALLLSSGVLADRYGRKLLFQIGLAVFTLGSLLCGLAQNPGMLIASRSFQGIGGAIMFAVSLALLGHSFRGKDRGVAFGAWGAVAGIATALGPVLGGLITTEWDWRGIFLINVPVGVLAIALTWRHVEESRSPHAPRLDLAGGQKLLERLTQVREHELVVVVDDLAGIHRQGLAEVQVPRDRPDRLRRRRHGRRSGLRLRRRG